MYDKAYFIGVRWLVCYISVSYADVIRIPNFEVQFGGTNPVPQNARLHTANSYICCLEWVLWDRTITDGLGLPRSPIQYHANCNTKAC
jgi:hypothetical protein